jgi:hypothetical protein
MPLCAGAREQQDGNLCIARKHSEQHKEYSLEEENGTRMFSALTSSHSLKNLPRQPQVVGMYCILHLLRSFCLIATCSAKWFTLLWGIPGGYSANGSQSKPSRFWGSSNDYHAGMNRERCTDLVPMVMIGGSCKVSKCVGLERRWNIHGLALLR